MERFIGKVAAVTGSSSGIGEAITKQFVKQGLTVVGLARRTSQMQKIAEELLSDTKAYTGKFYIRQCDVSKPAEIVESFQWITSKIGPVSVLINNAGFLPKTKLFDLNEEMYDKCFDTNVKGLIMCTKEAAKSMMGNESGGYIININSAAGHRIFEYGQNLHFVYNASKYAVTALSDGLRREVIKNNSIIKVTNLSAGSVLSEMTSNVKPVIRSDPNKILRAEDIADACIAVLNTPPHVVISELTIHAIDTILP